MNKINFFNGRGKSHRTGAVSKCDGFTLLDLTVAIAVVGLMAVMVLPALAGTKTNSKSFQCMNNMKQLALAWTMYAEESNDRMVNLSTYTSSGTLTSAPEGIPWRTQITYLTQPLLPGMVVGSQQAQKYLTEMGFKKPTSAIDGPLFKYCPNVDVIHCPDDTRSQLLASQGSGAYSGPYSWDSYAGSQFLNGESTVDARRIVKRNFVTRPSEKFVWAEGSAMRGENLGSWLMGNYGSQANNFVTAQFNDAPAAFHVTSANFNFCDGHVENHRWTSASTIAWANEGVGKDTHTIAANTDSQWVGSRYAGTQNP